MTINLNASFSVPTLFMDSEQWSNQTDTFFAEQKRLAEDLNDNSIAGWYTTASKFLPIPSLSVPSF